MRCAVLLLRAALAAVLGLCLWTAVHARAAAIDYLMVPSAAMGRDIPVAFMADGPHAVYLLDAFNAGDTVSNWVTAGDAMTTLAGTGVSVAAPAGGAYSLYTNWEQDGSRQWETFLSTSCPIGWRRTRGWPQRGTQFPATMLAPPVSASTDNPCEMALIPVCAFIPILPDLDHDIDLTTDQDPALPHTPDGSAP